MPTKEEFYDDHIFPLMKEILTFCKAQKISMVASFELDPDEDDPADPLMCTSQLISPETKSPSLREAAQILGPRRPVVLAETIETRPDGGKNVTIRRVS